MPISILYRKLKRRSLRAARAGDSILLRKLLKVLAQSDKQAAVEQATACKLYAQEKARKLETQNAKANYYRIRHYNKVVSTALDTIMELAEIDPALLCLATPKEAVPKPELSAAIDIRTGLDRVADTNQAPTLVSVAFRAQMGQLVMFPGARA